MKSLRDYFEFKEVGGDFYNHVICKLCNGNLCYDTSPDAENDMRDHLIAHCLEALDLKYEVS